MKKFLVLAFVVAAVLSISSCEKKAPSGGSTQQVITLSMMSWLTGSEDLYADIAQKFNQKYPNLNFTFQTKPFDQYWVVMDTLIMSGEAPDLFPALGTASTALAKWANQGAIAQLDGIIDTSGCLPYIVKDFMVDGKLYQTPALVGDYNFGIYNKDLFAQYNLSLPNSQADLIKLCDFFVSKGITPFYLAGKTIAQDDLINLTAAYAPTWNDTFPWAKRTYSDPEYVAVLKLMQDWVNKGYFGKDYASLDETAALTLYSQGKIAMRMGASYNLGDMKAAIPNTSVFFLKRADGSDTPIATPSQQYTTCLNAKTKYRDESITLMKYLMTPEVLNPLIKEFPAIPFNSPASRGITTSDPDVQKVVDAPNPVPCYMDQMAPIAAQGADIWTILLDTLTRLYYNQITPVEAAQAYDQATDWTLVK